jgi:hypothetical protein
VEVVLQLQEIDNCSEIFLLFYFRAVCVFRALLLQELCNCYLHDINVLFRKKLTLSYH